MAATMHVKCAQQIMQIKGMTHEANTKNNCSAETGTTWHVVYVGMTLCNLVSWYHLC